jgi:hypothetical protein
MARTWRWIVGLVMLVGSVFLQLANSWGVRGKVCKDGCDCPVKLGFASLSVVWPLPSLPRELHSLPAPRISTALLRSKCDGSLTLGLGARFDAAPIEIAEHGVKLSFTSACLDADVQLLPFLTHLRGAVQARFVKDGCTLKVESLEVERDDRLHVRLQASVQPETALRCQKLLPPQERPLPVDLLEAAALSLSSHLDLPPDTGTAPAACGAPFATLRQALEKIKTSHELSLKLKPGSLRLGLATSPVAGHSPQLELSVAVDPALSALFKDAPAWLAKPSKVRWNLDHEDGEVELDQRMLKRIPMQASRGAGRVVLGDEREREQGAAPPAAANGGSAPRSLFFVEADDQGRALMPAQTETVLKAVADAMAGPGALALVFVHGWQHSAAHGDDYVRRFSDVIRAVEQMEQHAAERSRPPRTARGVFGIYVGWPGQLYGNEFADSATTFWNRLDVADNLGGPKAVLHQLLDGLGQRIAAQPPDTRPDRRSMLVVEGHSMGGRAVFRTFDAALSGATSGDRPPLRADLALLVNPAFSASWYRALHEREAACQPTGVPYLMFSSLADIVTRGVYPSGQAVAYDRTSKTAVPFLEYVYTAANFEEFVTHALTIQLAQGQAQLPEDHGEQTILRGFERVPEGTHELRDDEHVHVYRLPPDGRRPEEKDRWYHMDLEQLRAPPCVPARGFTKVIAVDRRIIPDHGTIFTPPFTEYIVRLLNHRVGGG